MLRNQQSMDTLADLWGKPRVAINVPPEPKKRAPREATGIPLEKDVQKQIIDGLRSHPMIGLVERINSGTAVERGPDGRDRHIQFHHVYSTGYQKLRSVDLHCTLKPSGRRFVIEVKRPGFTGPKGVRELEQLNYLRHIKACGGYGMFATDWSEVEIELRRISEHERGIPTHASRWGEDQIGGPVVGEVPRSRR